MRGSCGQVAEAALADHPPGRRLGLAAEHLEQAGLAGAVAPDEADLVAGITVNEASATISRPPTSTESPAPATRPSRLAAETLADNRVAGPAPTRAPRRLRSVVVEVTAAGARPVLRRIAPIAGGAAVVAGAVLVATNDPAAPGSHFPACAFHSATGLWCPGCGLTRGLHALLDGHLGTAHVVERVHPAGRGGDRLAARQLGPHRLGSAGAAPATAGRAAS